MYRKCLWSLRKMTATIKVFDSSSMQPLTVTTSHKSSAFRFSQHCAYFRHCRGRRSFIGYE